MHRDTENIGAQHLAKKKHVEVSRNDDAWLGRNVLHEIRTYYADFYAAYVQPPTSAFQT